jgi:GntR family transcriptional regulator, transcriptional repressor for pyruvate dehydrogenase complex
MNDKAAPFGKLKKSRLFEGVAKQLRNLVDTGVLKPGDQLPPERSLAEKLGVSRTSVREAIRAMELTGEVETRVGVSGGTFIRKVSLSHAISVFQTLYKRTGQMLSDVVEVRLILETRTASLAAERRTEEHLEAIALSITEMEDDLRTGGIGIGGDHKFHLAVAQASENEFLFGLSQLVEDIIEDTRRHTLEISGVPEESLSDHRTISNAIRDRDSSLAESMMRAHLLKAYSLSKDNPK